MVDRGNRRECLLGKKETCMPGFQGEEGSGRNPNPVNKGDQIPDTSDSQLACMVSSTPRSQ